jgi:hypothetical protein
MKFLKKCNKKLVAAGTAIITSSLVITSTASAWDIVPADFSLVSEAADVADIGAAIVVGLAGMWGLRKVIKTLNRS